jgi:hypothetical protein
MESDAIAELLERRWFAVQNACTAQRHECEYIRQSLELAETAWRRAHARLRELEEMREYLDAALAELDASEDRMMNRSRGGPSRRVMSAA